VIRRLALTLAVLCLPVGVAGGDAVSWSEAAKAKGAKAAKAAKNEKLRNLAIAEGNDQLALARERARSDVQQSYASGGGRPRSWSAGVITSARAALAAYERALSLDPATANEEAELHYRCVLTAYRFLDDPDGHRALVEHGDAMRIADPLDTREIEVTWDMSVSLSKLGALGGAQADAYFERGIAEYEHWRQLVDEASPNVSHDLAMSWSNAAELMMAVGRLDESIDAYEEAVDLDSTEALGFYGLAVALDRDGQWEKARAAMADAVIRDRGALRLDDPLVFFVPEGDIHYYKALSAQVRNDKKTAIAEYKLFLTETVDTKYAARGREHLSELGVSAPDDHEDRR
jgi:tetratricopeptide (TPR) repeat protein